MVDFGFFQTKKTGLFSDMLQQICANISRSILGLSTHVRNNAISWFHCLLGAQGQGENARRTVKEAGG